MGDPLNVSRPYWDLSTFFGRWRHFAWLTDPRTIFTRTSELYKAKATVERCRLGETTGVTAEQLKYARKLTESSFHPDSGELQNVFGRMSFQMPGGMIITGAMLSFYRSNSAVIFWQWVNQSFNALVNYTNRNAASGITAGQIAFAYVTATSAAVFVSVGLKAALARRASPLMQRFVPFAAVASANCVNIPMMRQAEFSRGVICTDERDVPITQSRYAAAKGVSQVTLSRIAMAAPGMLLCPLFMKRVELLPFWPRLARFNVIIQTTFVGCCLLLMVPTACAIFPQRASIATNRLAWFDRDRLDLLKQQYLADLPARLYFNKGL